MPDRGVFVTGAGGFIGCCAVRRLLDTGRDVHVFLRNPPAAWRLRDVLPRLHVHTGDMRSAADLRRALGASHPSVVVHCAAYGAYEAQRDWQPIVETIVNGTAHLIDAAVDAGVDLLVSTGSSSEYGYRRDAMRESDRLEPNSAYAIAKAAQTHLCALAARQQRLATITFRLFSVFGPWEGPTRLFPTIVRRALAGRPLEMVARDVARDYVYVDDALDLLLDFPRLAAAGGDVFNLGSGRQSTLGDVVEALEIVLGRRVEVRWGPMAPRRWDADQWRADPAKVQQTFGWTPRHDLVGGLRAFVEWYRTAQEAYAAAPSA